MTDKPAASHGKGLTAALADFAAGAAARGPVEPARDAARRAIMDTVGVLLAGRKEAPVALLGEVLRGGGEARSLALGRTLDARDAAFADGLAAHVLDYDDVARHGHPSVVMVPALLAEGQRIGASGLALLDACAVGEETWARIARCELGAYHMGAWHPTSVLGIVAAVGALCALHGLDAATSRNALALAASFAGGVIASFGTPAKPLQAGRAAASAIEAVALARAGLAGAGDALESDHGLLHGIAPAGGQLDFSSPADAGAAAWLWLEDGLSVKRYPVCYASHRAIDAMIDLVRDGGLGPGDVRSITASIGPAPAATLRYDRPVDGLEAKFSLHHNLAAALVDRAVGFAQLEDGFVRRPDVAALYPLTRVVTVAGNCPDQPGMAKFDRVVIETRDGRTLDSGPVRHPRGHARLPMSDAEIDAKFLDCARHGGVTEPAQRLEALRRLDEVADIREELARW